MLEELKNEVYLANIELVKRKMVIYTWGNVSGIDRNLGLIVIKPSGVDYNRMTASDMIVVDFDGNIVEGNLRPSSDTPTHLELYKTFDGIKGIAHTHAVNSVAFAQAGVSIPALGTTHADYFYGDIPCTRSLTRNEVETAYELNTGKVIAETVTNPYAVPGVLVKNHGPFSWGKSPAEAVYNSVCMEKVAEMALKTLMINSNAKLNQYILDKHYYRKHGKDAYYGQIE